MSKIFVVGIGPGEHEGMTKKADAALGESDVIIGYTVYVDLIRAHYAGKIFIAAPMMQETARCRKALEMARAGYIVSVVCSGDSGIYGMAALLYALRGESQTPEIEAIPGVTAACSGAALLGAPLTQDFAVISLSDRLTPWAQIEKRLENAAMADMVIVLYNPASRTRPAHVKRACDVLLRYLPADRICGIARNIGREGESSTVLSLGALREAETDMFCTIFIGNTMTKRIGEKMITARGYRDV